MKPDPNCALQIHPTKPLIIVKISRPGQYQIECKHRLSWRWPFFRCYVSMRQL